MNVRHDMVTVFVVRPTTRGSHEFLQLRRAMRDYMGGTWQIIRGEVNAHERYSAAALRELREEADLSPREFYRLGTVESFYIDSDDTLWHAAAFCAIVDGSSQVKLNDEHDDYRWIDRASIEREMMWSSERMLLAELIRDILDDSIARPHLRIALAESSP